MAAVVHIIKPRQASVFGDYTEMQLLPYLMSHMKDCTTRVDAVWDTYRETSLKSQARTKRGGGASRRTRVSHNIPMPKGVQWQLFLKDAQNKDELFQFVSLELQRITANSRYHLLTTKADVVLSNIPADLSDLSPCEQEEADTRMMLHLRHAADQGQHLRQKAYLRTVDSDVVVLSIHFFSDLGLSELWIGFGSGKSYKDIPIHIITEMMGLQRCNALTFFHAFTGCDVVSSMMGIGKKTAWNAWVQFPEITTTFTVITDDPTSLTLDSLHMNRLERLTVMMYSKNCSAQSVNEARKLMFTHGLKSLDSIPLLKMLFTSTPNVLFTLQDSCGNSPYRESRSSQAQVTGAGN